MSDVTGVRRGGLAVAAVLLAALPALAGWQIETIAPVSSMYQSPALTFDSQNRPHVVYADTSAVKYTTGGPGGWSVAVNTNVLGYFGAQSFVAVSGQTVYAGCSADDMLRASSAGGAWQAVSLNLGSQSLPCTMAVDLAGRLTTIVGRFATAQETGYYLAHRTETATEAHMLIPGVLPVSEYAYEPAAPLRLGGDMTFDAAGNIHTVQYYEIGGNGFLAYATGAFGGPYTVDTNLAMGWTEKTGMPSIAVDAAGKPHIAYTELWPYYGVKHLSLTDSGWVSETIETGGALDGYVGTFPDILVDNSGVLHVIYADGRNGLLKHAFRAADTWSIETIDTIGTQGAKGAMTGALAADIDSLGRIGVAYWDSDDGLLKYAMVPEPATLLLLAGGLGVVRLARRRR